MTAHPAMLLIRWIKTLLEGPLAAPRLDAQ